jgi:hypothetical protein
MTVIVEDALVAALQSAQPMSQPIPPELPEVKKKEEEPIVEMEGITADFLQESIRLHLGNDYFKYVSYEDFLSILAALVGEEASGQVAQPIWFPPGVFFFSRNALTVRISMYYPECVREVMYGTHRRKSIIPNIIISHDLKITGSDRLKSVNTIYLTTNKVLSELPRKFYNSPNDPGMSTMPFGNCYTDGRLCFGSNVKIVDFTLPDLRPLHWYYDMLFTTPFNNDLTIHALRSDKYRGYPDTWYTYLADLAIKGSSFPYKELRNF